jgi:hypothetical protein
VSCKPISARLACITNAQRITVEGDNPVDSEDTPTTEAAPPHALTRKPGLAVTRQLAVDVLAVAAVLRVLRAQQLLVHLRRLLAHLHRVDERRDDRRVRQLREARRQLVEDAVVHQRVVLQHDEDVVLGAAAETTVRGVDGVDAIQRKGQRVLQHFHGQRPCFRGDLWLQGSVVTHRAA